MKRNGYRGDANTVPTPTEAPPENGLVSIYLSPNHESSTVHWINTPVGEGLLCKPNMPTGRLLARPEATEPTCGRCILTAKARAERGN